MYNDVSNKPKTSTLFDSKTVDTVKGRKHQKKAKTGSYKDKVRQKLSQLYPRKKKTTCKKSGCRIRMLIGYGDNEKMNATVITTKVEVDYQYFAIQEGTK